MRQTSHWPQSRRHPHSALNPSSWGARFNLAARYPIFLLALGPPIFRPPIVGTDTSQAHFDLWSVFQVGWICVIASRAVFRLANAQSLHIPRQVRSILKYPLFLGLLFLISVAYSPGKIVSIEFTFIYFLTLACIIEFVASAYQNPPDWIQCLLLLRFFSLLLLAIVLLTLPVAPSLVLAVIPGEGVRLIGNAVGSTTVFCPIIAIISAYTFRHSLEPRSRAGILFAVGFLGTLITQSRGPEIALLLALGLLLAEWARTGRRIALTFISACMTLLLVAGGTVSVLGWERVWLAVNRGEDASRIATASGRTEIWKFAIQYSMTHPLGMGYVAGFRSIFTNHFDFYLGNGVTHLGTTHNAFIQYLVDGGWLGFALYLGMLLKIFSLGIRLKNVTSADSANASRPEVHAIRCAMLLLVFCLVDGMDSSVFTIPLQQPFYYQNILYAILLGAAAQAIRVSRLQAATWIGPSPPTGIKVLTESEA